MFISENRPFFVLFCDVFSKNQGMMQGKLSYLDRIDFVKMQITHVKIVKITDFSVLEAMPDIVRIFQDFRYILPCVFPLFSGKKWVSVQYFRGRSQTCGIHASVCGVCAVCPLTVVRPSGIYFPLVAEGVISRCNTWEKRTAEWHQSHGDENICRILRDYFSSFVNKTLSLQERGLRPSKRSNTL